jgi:thiopurine S-methyltransferase
MSLKAPPDDGDVLRLKDWSSRWHENRIGFHKEVVNPRLLKHLPMLTSSNAGGKETVFVPLCGKTKDLKFLEEKGFNVVGLEYAEKGGLKTIRVCFATC